MKTLLTSLCFLFLATLASETFATSDSRPSFQGIVRCAKGTDLAVCYRARMTTATTTVMRWVERVIPNTLGFNVTPRRLRPRNWQAFGRKIYAAMCRKDEKKCAEIDVAKRRFAGKEGVYQLNPDPSVAEVQEAQQGCKQLVAAISAVMKRVGSVNINGTTVTPTWRHHWCSVRYTAPRGKDLALQSKIKTTTPPARRTPPISRKMPVVITGPDRVDEGKREPYTLTEPSICVTSPRKCQIEWDALDDDGNRRLRDCRNETECTISFPKKGPAKIRARVRIGKRRGSGRKDVTVIAKPPAEVSVRCKKAGDDGEGSQSLDVKVGDRVTCTAISRDPIRWERIQWQQEIVDLLLDDGTKSGIGTARKGGAIPVTAISTTGPGRGSAQITVTAPAPPAPKDRAPEIAVQSDDPEVLEIADSGNGIYQGTVEKLGKTVGFTWNVHYSEPLTYVRGGEGNKGQVWFKTQKPKPDWLKCRTHPSPRDTSLWQYGDANRDGFMGGIAIQCSGTPDKAGRWVIHAHARSKTGIRAKPKTLALTVGDPNGQPTPLTATATPAKPWIFGERFFIAVEQLWGQHGSSATDDTLFLKTDTTVFLQYWFTDWLAAGFNVEIQNHQIFRYFRKDDFGQTTRFNLQAEIRSFSKPEKTGFHHHLAVRLVGRLPATENKSANNTAEGLSVSPGAALHAIAAIGFQWSGGSYLALEIPALGAILENGQQATIGVFAHLSLNLHKPYFTIDGRVGVLASAVNQTWHPTDTAGAKEAQWLFDIPTAFLINVSLSTDIPGFGKIILSAFYSHEFPGTKYRGLGQYGLVGLAVGESRILNTPLYDLTNLSKGGGSAAAAVKP